MDKLFRPYIVEILTALKDEPKLYIQLEDACVNEGTRTRKLKELQDAGLIKKVLAKYKGKEMVHYALTDKGKEFLVRSSDA